MGANEFSRKYEFKVLKVDDSKVLFIPILDGWYFAKPTPIRSDHAAWSELCPSDLQDLEESNPQNHASSIPVSSEYQDLHNCLHISLKEKVLKFHMPDSEAEKMLTGNISVHQQKNQIYGGITCEWCKFSEKTKLIKISAKKIERLLDTFQF